jgi:hypothetical protein
MPRSIDSFDTTPEAVQLLNENILDVYFIKRSTGALRRMHCTLNPDNLPFEHRATAADIISRSGVSDTSTMPLPVWDILMGGWRSFYIQSVQNVLVAKQWDDALDKVKEIAEQQTNEEPAEPTEGIIEGVIANVINTLKSEIKGSPERLLEFSIPKIKEYLMRKFLK